MLHLLFVRSIKSTTIQLPTVMSGLNMRSAEIDYRTCQDWTTASAGTSSCPDNLIVTGLKCATNDCTTIQIKCCQARGTHDGSATGLSNGCMKNLVTYTVDAVVYSNYAAQAQVQRVLRQTKEHRFASGIECNTATSCKQVRLHGRLLNCVDTTYMIEDEWREGASTWSAWISAAGDTVECPRHTAVTGVDCTGLECKKMRIECSPFGHVCRTYCLFFSRSSASIIDVVL